MEAMTEKRIIARHPGPPPRGLTSRFRPSRMVNPRIEVGLLAWSATRQVNESGPFGWATPVDCSRGELPMRDRQRTMR